MKEWKDGDFYEKVDLYKVIALINRVYYNLCMSLSSSFAHLLFQGKVDSVLQLLSSQHHLGKVLSLNEVVDDSGGLSVKDILKEKHLKQQSVCSSICCVMTILFQHIYMYM